MSGVIDLASALVRLAPTLTAAGAASVDIAVADYIAAGYKKFIIEAKGVKGSVDDAQLSMYVKTGGAWGSPDYYLSSNGANPPVLTYGAGGVVAFHSGTAAAANQIAAFTTEFTAPNAAADAKIIQTRGAWYSGYSGIPVNKIDSTVLSIAATAITDIRFMMSPGTLTGKFDIFGVK
ncbi:MAG TPA: hypothetical protein VEC35_23420 [Noviherbaspirillum sp.]|nr:hypothetical protein [Noviherbaspirillum sp.]